MRSTHLETLPIIDWSSCIHLYKEEAEVADLLSLLAKEIKERQIILDAAYAKQDFKKIVYELDRMISGVCYLTLPQLAYALSEAYKAVTSEQIDLTKLASTDAILSRALKHFHLFWDAYSLPPR